MKHSEACSLIRLALLESRQNIDLFRSTGITRRGHSPRPQKRFVRLYNRAYSHGLKAFA